MKIFSWTKNILFIFTFLTIFGTLPLYKSSNTFSKYKSINKFLDFATLPSKVFYEGTLESIKILRQNSLLFHPTSELIVENKYKDSLINEKGGFTFSYEAGSKENAGFVILSFNEPSSGDPKIEIWDLNNQNLIHSYPIPKDQILSINNKYPNSISERRYLQLTHPILLGDGSIVVSANSGSLIKIDKCGKILDFNDEHSFHHSIEIDNEGLIYVPIASFPGETYFMSMRGYKNSFRNEGFAILDQDLNIVDIYSLKDIFLENGLLDDVLSNRNFDEDPFHLNDVHPFYDESNNFKKVFLSMRHYGLMSFDITNKKLIWLIKGATNLQHDITPLDEFGTKVSVFDNGSIFNNHSSQEFVNSMLTIENLPIKQNKKIPYLFIGNNLEAQGLLSDRYQFKNIDLKAPETITGGKGEFFNNGKNLYIEETNLGRIFELDFESNKYLWKYINKNSTEKDHLMVSWSRRIESLPINQNIFQTKSCSIQE